MSTENTTEPCKNGAPYICYKTDSGWRIAQGSCNSWTCPRCGEIRAKREYARIVHGAEELGKTNQLYFITITCRGRDMPLAEAEENYLAWTNTLLTSMRARVKKNGDLWAYAAVTERQRRGHPHSHILSASGLGDDRDVYEGDTLSNGIICERDGIWSDYLHKRCVKIGLGPMCDISLVKSPSAVSRYIAKYLFKTAMNTEWPPGWRRIRYSQSWPKLPDQKTEGFPLINMQDWARVSKLNERVRAMDEYTYHAALARLVVNVLPPREKISDKIIKNMFNDDENGG